MGSAAGKPWRSATGRIVVLAVLAGGILPISGGCDAQDKDEATPPPPAVTVTTARQQAVREGMRFIGRIEAVERVDIMARVQGVLETRAFREGEPVEEGALLYTIEPDQYEAALDLAKANVAKAAALAQANARQLERTRLLRQRGNISQAKLEQVEAEQKGLEADFLVNEARLREAELDLSYTRIHAPFAGRMGGSVYSAGNLVGPESGRLATLVKLDPIRVVFAIDERQIVAFRKQGAVAAWEKARAETRVRLKLADGSFYGEDGSLDFSENQIDPSTGTVAVRAIFQNPGGALLPNEFVEVIVEDREPHKALVVPQASVQEDQQGSYVLFVDKDDKVAVRRVEMGDINGINQIVKKGLEEGDRIIVEGFQKVRAGITVAPAPASAPAGSQDGG